MRLTKAQLIEKITPLLEAVNIPLSFTDTPITIAEGDISRRQLEFTYNWLKTVHLRFNQEFIGIYCQPHVTPTYWESVKAIGINDPSLLQQKPVVEMKKFLKSYKNVALDKFRPVSLGGQERKPVGRPRKKDETSNG